MKEKSRKNPTKRKSQVDSLTEFVLNNKNSIQAQRIVAQVLNDKDLGMTENVIMEFRAQVGRMKTEELNGLENIMKNTKDLLS